MKKMRNFGEGFMYIMDKKGWVEVICGSMFSGKSEELIRRVQQAKYGNLSVQVFKPAIDDSFSDDLVVSHNGSTTIAYPIKKSIEILQHIGDRKDIDIVAIDEAQFFDEDIVGIVDELAHQAIRVIIAGLDTDFRGVPFGAMPELMALSEPVSKLNAICPIFRSPASRTQRLIRSEERRVGK